jgi:hypothetical protein
MHLLQRAPDRPRVRRPVLKRPSPALVVATLALLTSVTGNAAAAVVITANNQVAAHVIAGANAPSGDTANLIPASVGTTDLHAGAVTPAKLSGEARPHLFNYAVTGLQETKKTVLQLDELSLSIDCQTEYSSGFPYDRTMFLALTSSVAGDAVWSSTGGGATGSKLQPNVLTTITLFDDRFDTGYPSYMIMQVVYHNANRVITLTFSAEVDWASNHKCQVTGTAVPATLK